MSKLKPRERDAIVQALRAGVVPKLGLRHLQVGRAHEIEELVKDIDRIADGGSAIRFIIGEYGSGKTFFMNLIRLVALEKGLVVMFADLAPDRRLHATSGQARSLYAEMARNLAAIQA
jgi:ABC-type polar amino acid transport system ATPase subunit